MEQSYTRDFEHGKTEGIQFSLDDIQFGFSSSTFNTFDVLKSKNTDDLIRFHFGLRGDYKFSYDDLNQSFDLIGGHYNVMYSQGLSITVENKSNAIDTFGISITKNSLEELIEIESKQLDEFLEAVSNKKAGILSQKWGRINPKMENIFYDLQHCPYEQPLKSQYYQNLIEELIHETLNGLLQTEEKGAQYIQVKADREKIIKARDYINERIEAPPTLQEVSKSVGLNQFKLKHGFKEMFGSTIFQYVTEQRLHLAKRYLLIETTGVSRIAHRLGYATAQHFNNAFKKKFGTPPNSFRKNPKNAMPNC